MPSLDSAASELARGVREGWPDADQVRVLAQAVEDFARVADPREREAFLCEPRLTGSEVWDAALAGLAVHLCRSAGMDTTPPWTREPHRYVTRIAWPGLAEGSTLQAYVYQRTPAYFKARGVMLNAENLVSV